MSDKTGTAGSRFRLAVEKENPLQVVGAINAYHARLAEAVVFLWFWWLAPILPALIEAMATLAVHWRFHRRAAPILKRGGKHRDKRVRQAAGAHARLREDEEDPRLRVMI